MVEAKLVYWQRPWRRQCHPCPPGGRALALHACQESHSRRKSSSVPRSPGNVSLNHGFRLTAARAGRQIPGAYPNGRGCQSPPWTPRRVGSMLLRRIGVLVAVIVFLFALARISSIVVDWAWFSSIGYVGVFSTALATKAALFVVVFAVSTLLLWANATLALRFASRLRGYGCRRCSIPPWWPFQASPGPSAGSYGLQPSPAEVWRLIILAVALILGLLIAMGETGKWDLILRFISQAAVRPERSVLRQGHIGFLPLLTAGLRRAQELSAVDPGAR